MILGSVLIYCATNTCGTDSLYSERNLLQGGLTLTHGVSVTFTSTDSIKNAQDFVASVTLLQERDENLLGHNKEEKCQLVSVVSL